VSLAEVMSLIPGTGSQAAGGECIDCYWMVKARCFAWCMRKSARNVDLLRDVSLAESTGALSGERQFFARFADVVGIGLATRAVALAGKRASGRRGVTSPVMYLPSKHDASNSVSAGLARVHRMLQRVELLVDQQIGADLARDRRLVARCARSARPGSACRCRTRFWKGAPAAQPMRNTPCAPPASRAICTMRFDVVPANDRIVDQQHDLVLEFDAPPC